MTRYQLEQYQIRYAIDGEVCQKCGKPAECIAHRIARTKVNYKIYGKYIIDHNINLTPSCLKDNSYFNIGMNPNKCNKLVNLIKRYYSNYTFLDCKEIERILNE